MKFKIKDLGDGVTVVQLEGRLNLVNAPRFRDMVNSAVAEGHTRLAIDLSGVEFMDSSGLGALISGLKSARQAGGDLRISSPTDQVKLVLQLTNMERVLVAYEHAESAYSNG